MFQIKVFLPYICCVLIVIVVMIVVIAFQLFTVVLGFYVSSLSIFIVTYYVRKKIDRNDVKYKFSELVLGLIAKMFATFSSVLKSFVCDCCTVSTVLHVKYTRVCVFACVCTLIDMSMKVNQLQQEVHIFPHMDT